jgi:AcrR family transcriptional regulator
MITTKEKLLEVAFNEFLKHSYRDVTLSHLVKELGLSKGAFYYYFASKQDLFNEVVDYYLIKITDFQDIEYDENLSLVDNIMRLIGRSLDIFTAIKTNCMNNLAEMNYYNFLIDATKYYPDFIKKINEIHKKKEIEFYIEFISIAKNNGDVKISIDSLVLAKLIQAVFDGIGFNSYFQEKPDYLIKQIDESLNFIYELIKK